MACICSSRYFLKPICLTYFCTFQVLKAYFLFFSFSSDCSVLNGYQFLLLDISGKSDFINRILMKQKQQIKWKLVKSKMILNNLFHYKCTIGIAKRNEKVYCLMTTIRLWGGILLLMFTLKHYISKSGNELDHTKINEFFLIILNINPQRPIYIL